MLCTQSHEAVGSEAPARRIGHRFVALFQSLLRWYTPATAVLGREDLAPVGALEASGRRSVARPGIAQCGRRGGLPAGYGRF
jgi:hypothetical protein